MISKVSVETQNKNNITQLKTVFFSIPFKVLEIREDKKQKVLELMLMSSSPGILDEDELYFEYLINEGNHLELTTQSYQRLFTMNKRAIQETTVTIKENGFFCYLPHPCVPHLKANFKSTNIIYLEKKASLLWCDIITCGRNLENEIFKFTKLHTITKIYQSNKLVYFENLFLNPEIKNPLDIVQFEGYTHQLNLIFINESFDPKKLKIIIEDFFYEKDCLFGISEAPTNGLVLKVLHTKGEKLTQWMKQLATIIKSNVRI